MFSQLLGYSFLTWIAWLVLSVVLPYCSNFKGFVVGYLLIILSIPVLDVIWIQSEMGRPGWEGNPDMDVIFYLGVLFRTALVCAVLTPITVAVMLIKKRAVK
ncbi:hypothetical protein [Teredinibacter sp. KSP-S5-2]|uniref:hypothetical protein n=1 Tax=Teredinibacter sp. KSP-S5-2 TaxID=3034506 RepID=UPI0029340E92|nr:hypothetical protein [Teredinibacter sp. KSP-S5-2]WNO11274.1 hypothetical protein P5V12_08830 [Teredinibacter sp. KSP-S5-2]